MIGKVCEKWSQYWCDDVPASISIPKNEAAIYIQLHISQAFNYPTPVDEHQQINLSRIE